MTKAKAASEEGYHLTLALALSDKTSFLHLLGPTWDAIVMPARDRCHAATATATASYHTESFTLSYPTREAE